MKILYKPVKISFSLLLFLLLTLSVEGQTIDSENQYYKVFDDFVGVENSEVNNGSIFSKKYRVLDKSHMFFGENDFVNGQIVYKDQTYFTNLKYDILNDLLVIKYIDATNAYSLSLNSTLVSQFTIDTHTFVKLPINEGIDSFYGNGFFEEVYNGDTYTFFIKHKKKTKTNIAKNAILYQFKNDEVFLFLFKDKFYEVSNKYDIIKVLPQHKKYIKDYFGKKKEVNPETLSLLFNQLDKIATK